ncbi:MAG: hypothetical protein AAF722_02780 [Cyanobacteria bacterium P01_C01_bin.70]
MADLETLYEQKTTPLRTKSGGRKWRWQCLIAPLMGFSIVLHIALLFVPLPTLAPPEEENIEEKTSEEDEDAPIDILALSDIAVPELPPEAPPEQPQASAPPPPDAVPPPPDPAQVPETPPEPSSEEQLPVDDGLDDGPPSFDPTVATNQFLGDLSGLGVQDYTSDFGLPTPDLLRNPGSAVCFIDPSGGPVAGVRVVNWLDKEPQTLLRENLQEVYGPQGITFEPLPAFCGELYYQGLTPDGKPFMTISLVTLEGSTLLVVWEVPPQ